MTGEEYRRVRAAGDELVHYADPDATHTLGCHQPITTEPPHSGDTPGDTAAGGPQLPACGPCVVEWMAATGQTHVVARHASPTVLSPRPAPEHPPPTS